VVSNDYIVFMWDFRNIVECAKMLLVMRYGLLTTVNQAHIMFCGKNVPCFISEWSDFRKSVHILSVCVVQKE